MPYKEFCVFFTGKLFYKSNRKRFPVFAYPDINTRGIGRILPTPLVFISAYANTENVFYCLTTNHAITYTNHYNVKLQKSMLKILIVVR